MSDRPRPCEACPWTQPGRPDITEVQQEAAQAGRWFCCHVRMGTCWGAKLETEKAAR